MDTIVYDAVQDVKAVAEYNGGGIETLLNGRVVKSVQSGIYGGVKQTNSGKTEIAISKVDTAKSIMVLNERFSRASGDGGLTISYELALDGTKIIIKNSGNPAYHRLFWQVVEFY